MKTVHLNSASIDLSIPVTAKPWQAVITTPHATIQPHHRCIRTRPSLYLFIPRPVTSRRPTCLSAHPYPRPPQSSPPAAHNTSSFSSSARRRWRPLLCALSSCLICVRKGGLKLFACCLSPRALASSARQSIIAILATSFFIKDKRHVLSILLVFFHVQGRSLIYAGVRILSLNLCT